MTALIRRVRHSFAPDHHDRDFHLFLVVGLFSGLAMGIYSTVFNNYLNDVFALSSESRGIVEFPRELPGVLVVLVLAVLSFLGDTRMAVVGMLFAALGAAGLGFLSPSFALMLLWLMVFSLGTHVVMPLAAGIGMSLSRKEEYGARLGRFSAYSLGATILGYAIVWVGFRYLGMGYRAAFLLCAAAYGMAALMLGAMKVNRPESHKVRLVFRKRYTLYYLLCVVNGARKQVFLTFAPWVLIKVFHLDPPLFAVLGILVALLGMAIRTVVGRSIDRRGERFVLTAEALVLLALCLGYAFSEAVLPAGLAVVVIAACYVVDSTTVAVDMARSTYVSKIAERPEDVTPTLSAGISVDHVVAMSIPILGGLLWARAGYQAVFLAAAVIALLNLVLSRRLDAVARVGSAAAADAARVADAAEPAGAAAGPADS